MSKVLETDIVVKKIDISKINPAKYNPRIDLQPDDPDYMKIKKSLDSLGLAVPLVWNKRNGNLVGGHQRLKMLIEAGYKKVHVSVRDLDDTEEKALNLSLNENSGRRDHQKTADILTELDAQNVDLDITGFGDDGFEEIMNWTSIKDDIEDNNGGEGSGEGEEVCFDIIVECNSEAEQKKLMKKFKKDGIECRKS